MRLPPLRFTVGRLMAAVAVLALVLAVADQLRRRRESFQQRAEVCRRRVSTAYFDEQAARGAFFGYDPRTTAAYYQLVEHYDALRVKYEQAAARPWWFVEPDPPEPVWPRGVRRWERPKGMPRL